MLHGKLSQSALRIVGIDRSRWIARRICQQHPSARSDLRRDLIRIGLKFVLCGERERHRNCAESETDRRIAWKSWIGIQDFIARIKQRHHRLEECNLASGSDD